MTGAGGRPRDMAGFMSWVSKELSALQRRQLPRSATADARVEVTSLAASGMTVGTQGVSYQRIGAATHIRGVVARSGSETGLLFTLPDGLRPPAREWVLGHAVGSPRVGIYVEPNGDVLVQGSVADGAFSFSHTFPSLPAIS